MVGKAATKWTGEFKIYRLKAEKMNMSEIDKYFLWVDETSLLYFYSALAQCAAAFAALAGVFATFQLQANAGRVNEAYVILRWWLATNANVHNTERLPRTDVKVLMEEIKRGKRNPELSKMADERLKPLTESESFNSRIANLASDPMRWWAGIFLFALLGIPLLHKVDHFLGFLDGIVYCTAVVVALQKTRSFIQECLKV